MAGRPLGRQRQPQDPVHALLPGMALQERPALQLRSAAVPQRTCHRRDDVPAGGREEDVLLLNRRYRRQIDRRYGAAIPYTA